MSEFFTQYGNANARSLPISQLPRFTALNPQVYDAFVTTVGPIEAITRSAIVYIPALKIYSNAVRSDCPDLSVNCIGKTYPLSFGDRVTVRFLGGDVNASEIVSRDPSTAGLKAFVMQEDHPIPQPGDTLGDYTLNPPPVCYIAEAAKYAFNVTVEVSRFIS
jgi:hypothetical protein